MSNTSKDQPFKFKYASALLKLRGLSTPKKPKSQNTDLPGSPMPGWWVRLMMTRPQRRKAKLWEREASKFNPSSPDCIDRIQDIDVPLVCKKPYVYYW